MAIPFESPLGVELEGKIRTLRLYRHSSSKRTAFILLSILTLGFFALFCFWFKKLRIRMTLTRATIKNATTIVVEGEGKNFTSISNANKFFSMTKDESLETIGLQKGYSISETQFNYRKFGFIYSVDRGMFVPIQFDLSKFSFKEIQNDFGKGLTSSEAAHNIKYYGGNNTLLQFSHNCFREKRD